MNTLLNLMLSNALVAAVLFSILMLMKRWIKNPAVLHLCLLLILVKLITPAYWQPHIDLLSTASKKPTISTERISPEDAASAVISNPTIRPIPQTVDPTPTSSELIVPSMNAPAENESSSLVQSTTNNKTKEAPSMTTWQSLLTSDTQTGTELLAQLFVLAWLVGTMGWFLLAIWRMIRFQKYLRQAIPASKVLNETAARLAQRISLKSVPQLEVVSGNVSPLLWACFSRARIILPSRLLEQLNDAEIETLLLHELAHYRRRDHWVRLLELLSTGVYWWNPVLWWVRREIRSTEEVCCDAWVVEILPEKRRSYAEVLVKAIGFVSQPTRIIGATGIGSQDVLEQRVIRIMCDSPSRKIARQAKLGIAVIALILLPLAPMLGQSPTQTSDVEDKQTLPTVEEILSGYRTNFKKLMPVEMTYQFHIQENMNCIHEDRRQLKAKRQIANLKYSDIIVDGKMIYDERTFPLLVGEMLRQAEELEAQLKPDQINARLAGWLSERSYFWTDGKSFQRRWSQGGDKLSANLSPAALSPASLPTDYKYINIISAIDDAHPTFRVWFGANSNYPFGQGRLGNDLNQIASHKTFAPLGVHELNWPERPDWYRLDYYLTRPAEQYRVIGWKEFRGRRTVLMDGFFTPRNQKTGLQYRYRLWIDPGQGYLPLRMEWANVDEQGQVVLGLHHHLDVLEIKSIARGFYPVRIEFQNYTFDSLAIEKQIEEIGIENLENKPPPPLPLVPGRTETWEVTHFTPNKPKNQDELGFEFPQGAVYWNNVDGKKYKAGKSPQEIKPASLPPQIQIGEAAPALQVSEWLDGKPHHLNEYRGKVIVLLFFSGVQETDYSEVPSQVQQQLARLTKSIKTFHTKYSNKGVVFVEVHPPGTEKEKILAFHEFRKLKTLAAIDQVSQSGGASNIQFNGVNMDLSLYLIGRDGKIALNQDCLEGERGELAYRYAASKLSIPLPLDEYVSEEEAMQRGIRIMEFMISEQIDNALAGKKSPFLIHE